MKWPAPVQRIFDWLEPPGSRIAFEPPPGVARVDWRVVLALAPVAAFTALVFAAPLLIAPGSTGDLSGGVGLVDNEQVWASFPQPARFVYHAGDVGCHTKSERSVEYGGNQMPFCTRDVAIFAGATVGLLLCIDAKSRAYRKVVVLPWWTYLALLLPVALDGGMQDFLGFESDNLRRVLTGFLAGLAVAFALVYIAYETHFVGRKRGKRGGERSEPQSDDGAGASGGSGSSGASGSSRSTGTWGSKAVDSAPTEKKKTFAP